jgi:LDH2 family malate/lactate/ureidoglycolate dehydrogenase
MTAALRESPPIDPEVPVQVPGDPEREWESRTGRNEVLIESDCWDDLRALATAENTIRVADPSGDAPTYDRSDE